MKPGMIKSGIAAILAVPFMFTACKKTNDTPSPNPVTENFSTLDAFYKANDVKSQTFSMDAGAGGSFTTAKGTKVTVPANAFVDANNQPVTGNINIEFKDIYKKSDMLLGQMPVMLGNGAPLKSAGEFFIRVKKDSTALNLADNKGIRVEQPADKADSNMRPFVMGKGAGGAGWQQVGDSISGLDTVRYLTNSYLFSLYKFSQPVGNGTWCNSDNPNYFSAYTQTSLTINTDFKDSANSFAVYLIFKDVNSMVHVYDNGSNVFPYNYAPTGLQCTVVGVGVKNGKLYASYDPITISANQTLKITPAETTSDAFIAKIKALD